MPDQDAFKARVADIFRRMTPDERAIISVYITDEVWRILRKLPPEMAQRILDEEREPWNPPQPELGKP